ncbi:AAA family ATPase [Actinomyces sp. HMT897]|uniref:ATP-binding protein n=1 Tax=Actinomyces sp. HMT897 TaxID=2789424 RepID=UPI001FEE291B|nr:AAA family ATPase [Actinomyces sp. HMT897]
MTPSYPLSLLSDGATWRGRALSGRTLDLLAALAGCEGARMGDDAIVGALWPADPPAHPLRALHVVVSRARAAVGEDVVERVGDGYRLALATSDVDARDLAARAARARACAATGQWDQVLELTDDLPGTDADVSAGTGPAGTGPAGGGARRPGPLARLRERAAAHAEAAGRQRALALEAVGEYEQAVPLLRAAAEREPDDETVLAALVRAQAWARSPAVALRTYEDYRLRLREQGAVPGPVARAAHEVALAAENPVRRGLEPVPEHFLGRQDDVAAVGKALGTHRLVTVTGPGGVGKTTLAQAVAARSRRPAVYVAALADVAPGADLVRVLLDALGSPPVADAEARASLGAVLAAPGTLLVLDNCEHLAGDVADLIGPLLATCADLRVLATSRRQLDLGAEHVYRLEPLDPASSDSLFRARALAARPGQVIDGADLEELLGRLEGIPLAIELAAARTRTLSVGQIAARLPARPDLLTGARDAPARQRTLRAVIAWSWDLLDDSERRGLASLALLPDGFTLTAAEALIGPEAADVLDALAGHCLLNVRDRGGVPRFHMLVTVRDFALARLAGSGGEEAARERLRTWVLEVCSEVRLPLGRHSFGDVGSPQAERQNLVFQQLVDDEAVVVQELDRVLQQVAAGGPGQDGSSDAACTIGAALMRLWSVNWSYDRAADYAPRLIALAVRPARSTRGNEARLSLLTLCASLSGLLGPLPEQVGEGLPRSLDGEDPSMARIRRFLRAPARQWPELVHDADPWVAWAAGRCLAAQLENEGAPEAALEVVENLLDRLRGADLAGIYLLELSTSRLQVLMTLGRYEQVADECARALELVDRLLPAWGASYREALQLDRAYCQVYLTPEEDLVTGLLAATDFSTLPGTLRFVARSVSGELELVRGRTREAALIQRASLGYAGRWRTVMGAGSPWELYILGMCLVTDVELEAAEAAELDAGGVRARAVPLLRDMLADPAPRQRDVPAVMAFAAAVGLSVMAAVGQEEARGAGREEARGAGQETGREAGQDAGPVGRDGGPVAAPKAPMRGTGPVGPTGRDADRRAAGAELVATALAVGTNQTCRLLSHDYLRTRAHVLDDRAMAVAEERVRHLDRARLLAHAAGLARRLADEAA